MVMKTPHHHCPYCRSTDVKRRRCRNCGARRRGELWTWTLDDYQTRPRRKAAVVLSFAAGLGLARGCATPETTAAPPPCEPRLSQCEADLALCESTPKDNDP